MARVWTPDIDQADPNDPYLRGADPDWIYERNTDTED